MTEKQEIEANLFALCLLMPKDIFIKKVEKLKPFDFCNDKKLKQLANEFGVTELMIIKRLQMLDIV